MLHSNFLFGILVLPKPQREAVKAVYAFCRAADDAVDLAPEAGAGGLAAWREEVELLFKSTPRAPLMRVLFPFVRIHRLKREYFDRILEGFAMDLARRRYATAEELETYCDCVAWAPGLLFLQVVGAHDEPGAREYARLLALGLQLTNILRDLGPDARDGRVYLPQSDLATFAVTEDTLRKAEPTKEFHELARYEVARARAYFSKAQDALTAPARRRLAGPEIMRETYEALLAKVAAAPDRALDPALPRASLPLLDRISIAFSTWLSARYL